ncbi:MAG: SIMPL domain-containing protein [Chloroflexota bacterium]
MNRVSESSGPSSAEQGSIVVSGTGRVAVQPDVADLRLGVSVSRLTVDEARHHAASKMASILEALTEGGVPKKDIRTFLLSVQPRYDYRDGQPPVLSGYELANVVEVTVRDLARLGDVVDGSLKAGATSMDSLTFRLADPAPAEREARILAMAEARSRADVLAEAAGILISGVSSVVEEGAMPPPHPFGKAERMMMAADVPTPVESGSLEIAVRVTVSYRTT